jgi:hypothetical protein
MADSPDPLPLAKPALERTSVEAYGGILAGIIGAVVTAWWAKAILLVVAAVLLVHVAFRSKWTIHWWRSAKWVTAIALVAFLGLIGWEPIADDFHKKHPDVSIGWLPGFNREDPPLEPFQPPDPNTPVQSNFGRVSYFCQTRRLGPNELEAFKRDKQAFAEAMGYAVVFSDLPNGGFKYDMTPTSPASQFRMMFTSKITMEIRQVTGGTIITMAQDLSGSALEIFILVPFDRDDEKLKKTTEMIERFASAAKGKCQLL